VSAAGADSTLLQEMMSVYVTLGIFLLLAARKPFRISQRESPSRPGRALPMPRSGRAGRVLVQSAFICMIGVIAMVLIGSARSPSRQQS